jgi:uracil phosphoribosyltransferase
VNVNIIEDRYVLALITDIRAEGSGSDLLKHRLFNLGSVIGSKIVADTMLSDSEVVTPMKQLFKGLSFSSSSTVIYSTKDDYASFARGISSAIPESLQGYMDFQGERGAEALTKPVRAVSHPEIKTGTYIETVIIAKAVLATGCTAISLTKNIMSKFHPKNLIVATAFYTESGINDLYSEIPGIQSIYVVGKPDSLTKEGMLIPGVGNLDARLSN